MRFFLGTHRPNWLAMLDVPLFVSHRTLRRYKTLPRACGPWALDSGGFTELDKHGGWRTTTAEYIEAVQRYAADVGHLEWAAPMDWMCEPFMLAKTGLTVREHQERTITNYLELRDHGPFIPVLQGWTLDDYEECVTLYALAGIDLTEQPLVGLGSVCRRQDTDEIDEIVTHLAGHGLNLHGFGVKKAGVSAYGDFLSSADSLAWSFRARRSDPMPGCTHKTCANCIRFAMHWREEVLARQVEVLAAPRQLRMFTGAGSTTALHGRQSSS